MVQMHNTGQAVKLTFGICRVHSDNPLNLRGVKRDNTSRREGYTNRIRRGISRIQIRIANFM
jgi:hypothetical protein